MAAATSTRTPMSTGLVRRAMPRRSALVDQPGGALAARRGDDGVGADLGAVGEPHAAGAQRLAVGLAGAAPFAALGRLTVGQDALDRHAGAHRHARLQVAAHAREDVVGALGAHVTHRRRDQRHPMQERLAPHPFGGLAAAVHVGRSAVVEPDAVDIGDELVQRLPVDEAVEPAADVGRQGQLAVGEGAGAAPAAGDVARVAAAADARGAGGAAAPVDVGPALDEEHRGAVAAHELECGEDAGGAGPYDDHVVVGACFSHSQWGRGDGKRKRDRRTGVPFPG